MSLLVNDGRAGLAQAVKDSLLHLAWGRGLPWWDQSRSDSLTFGGDDTVALARPSVSKVVVTSPDGVTTYVAGTDYTVGATAQGVGFVKRVTSGAIPAGAVVAVSYTTNRPIESPAASGLVDEIGRRKVTEVKFVVPDDQGEIQMTTGRFTESATATRHLLFNTSFAFDEGANETIREVGIFLKTGVKASVPPGQFYLTRADYDSPGILLLLQNSTPIIRNGATAQAFASVLTL